MTADLVAKRVRFGSITAQPSGDVDTSKVEGVDKDLIIRPFHQKGVAVSLRVFTNNAMNHHHGMQAVERFGFGRTGSRDFDEDGHEDELSAGDVTACTIYQAALQVPDRVVAKDHVRRWAAEVGETLFAKIGCTDCHVPALVLDSPHYSEPNPYNPPGNLRPQDVSRPFTFDHQGRADAAPRAPARW